MMAKRHLGSGTAFAHLLDVAEKVSRPLAHGEPKMKVAVSGIIDNVTPGVTLRFRNALFHHGVDRATRLVPCITPAAQDHDWAGHVVAIVRRLSGFSPADMNSLSRFWGLNPDNLREVLRQCVFRAEDGSITAAFSLSFRSFEDKPSGIHFSEAVHDYLVRCDRTPCVF